MSNKIILRPYQQQIIDEVRNHFKSGVRRVLIQLRTGAGKTAIAAHIVKGCHDADNVIWFCCHRKELIYQTSEAFDKMGIPHSFIAAGMPYNKNAKVQICSVPTLVKRYKKANNPDWIIWDETRMLGANTWKKIFHDNLQARQVGLDASPIRDNGGLGEFYGVMVQGPSYNELESMGYLSKYKAFAAIEPNLKGIKIKMGDYSVSELELEMSKPALVGSAVKEYLKHSNGKSAVVFCVNVAHSKLITQTFIDAGISARHLDGVTDNNERLNLIKDFKSGKIKVVCNVEILSCGFDFPGIETLIMLRPTQSLSLYLQQVGRVLRPAQGKEHALILDHSGNMRKFGLPCFEHEWSLEKKTKTKKSAVNTDAVKICTSCFAANENFNTVCNNCGEVFEIKQRAGPQEIDGELSEIDKLLFKKQQKLEQSEARTLEALIELGKRRGYKNPAYWAGCVMQNRRKRR